MSINRKIKENNCYVQLLNKKVFINRLTTSHVSRQSASKVNLNFILFSQWTLYDTCMNLNNSYTLKVF